MSGGNGMSPSARLAFAVVLTLAGCSSDAGGSKVPGVGGDGDSNPQADAGPNDTDDDTDDDDTDDDDADDDSPGPDAGPDFSSCGDHLLSAPEKCDDGNTNANDGCDDHCQIEAGWVCPIEGARCRAAACGDKILAGDEECEDGNSDAMDGCDDHCRLEPGYVCATLGKPCVPTVCGDSKVEGSEQCDDGANDLPFDGCFACTKEPSCGANGCEATCGDGIKFPGEACDDGNLRSADGCSSECKLEEGFQCSEQVQEPPAFVDLPIILRDFRGADLPAIPEANIAAGHVDFQNKNTEEKGIVKNLLGDDKKPVYAKADGTSASTSTAANFNLWYRDDPKYNRTVVDTVRLTRNDKGDYVFYDDTYFPLDGKGFVGEGHEPTRDDNHNFNFTSELRTQFAWQGGEFLEFKGDDDVWVFVNGHLAVDLGGVHGEQTGSVTIDDVTGGIYGMTKGNIYEIVVFQAERHTSASKYQLTLRDFVRAKTSCASICGDGVLTPDEACDDGENLGGYGQCAAGCVLGPRCGDGVLQSDHGEKCDDQNRVPDDECNNFCQPNVIL
jgi:fibro-slime domain-containing protein